MAREPSSLHPAAEREAEREFRYYQRVAGMGRAFLDALAAALDRVCESPGVGGIACQLRGETVRRLKLRRFSIRLVYVVRATHVRVIAAAHDRRRPFYWRRRS